MPSIPDWISQRLKKISAEEFINKTSHRTMPAKKNLQIVHEHYAIPLSSGCGTALLTAPFKEETPGDEGTLIIIFHALGHDCTYPLWHWIYEFVAHGIAVLSIDWDGHGASASSLLDIQEATRSIPLILQRLYGENGGSGLNTKRGGPRCFLMGYSFGANMALIAATRPEITQYICGVIAISPALCIQSFVQTTRETLTFFNPATWILDFFSKLGLYGFWGLIPAFGSFKRQQYPLRMKLDIDYIEQAREFARETFERRRILQKVKPPVLWLHGMKDRVCPYYDAGKLMLEIKSALFSYCDNSRGHLRMIFSDQALETSLKFVKNNKYYFNLNEQKEAL